GPRAFRGGAVTDGADVEVRPSLLDRLLRAWRPAEGLLGPLRAVLSGPVGLIVGCLFDPKPYGPKTLGGSCGRKALGPVMRPGDATRSGGRRSSLSGRLRDDLLCDVRGNLAVGVELHRVARPALG